MYFFSNSFQNTYKKRLAVKKSRYRFDLMNAFRGWNFMHSLSGFGRILLYKQTSKQKNKQNKQNKQTNKQTNRNTTSVFWIQKSGIRFPSLTPPPFPRRNKHSSVKQWLIARQVAWNIVQYKITCNGQNSCETCSRGCCRK